MIIIKYNSQKWQCRNLLTSWIWILFFSFQLKIWSAQTVTSCHKALTSAFVQQTTINFAYNGTGHQALWTQASKYGIVCWYWERNSLKTSIVIKGEFNLIIYILNFFWRQNNVGLHFSSDFCHIKRQDCFVVSFNELIYRGWTDWNLVIVLMLKTQYRIS